MILEFSGDFPFNLLCEKMGIQRSSFYHWKHTFTHPAERTKALLSNLALFEEYHLRYPSHGYRWLNAKIHLDTGTVMSDLYAHKCCKTLCAKSKAKHNKYKKSGSPFKIYPWYYVKKKYKLNVDFFAESMESYSAGFHKMPLSFLVYMSHDMYISSPPTHF